MNKYIGKNVNRVDALAKVTGKALYNDDLVFPDMLYGKILQSEIAHGLIKRVNIEKARKIDGVKAVVTGEDYTYLGGEALKDMPFLAREKVRYYGEPVAAVVAVDDAIAAKAVAMIEVEYEELPAVFNLEEALKDDAPLVHPDLKNYEHIKAVKVLENTNVCNEVIKQNGNVDQGFSEAEYIYEDTFTSHDCHHAPIEPFSAIARVDEQGLIKVWTTNSSVHRLRKDLCDALKIPQTKVQVLANYIGGSFGGKGGLKVEPIAIALALKTKNQPVKVVFTREEVFTATLTRHASLIKIKTGLNKEGLITARKIEMFYDTGAYAEKGPTVLIQGCDAAGGPYKIPNFYVKGQCVYTNKSIAGAYRGYGVIQPTWAVESHMDLLADRLGIDPVEFRLLNVLDEGDANCLGHKVYGVGLKECIRKAAEAIDWNEKKTKPNFQNIVSAKGIACGWEPTKTPSGSGVFITLNVDGSVNLSLSSSEVGQGSRTVLAQMAAEALHVPLNNIEISFPDTHVTPFDASTTSSRTTYHMGNAILSAAEDIVKELKAAASSLFDVTPDEVELNETKAFVKQDHARFVTYKEIVNSLYGAGGCILGKAFYYPAAKGAGIYGAPSVFWMFGAQAAEVEVDKETGQIKVTKVAAAHNVGRAINPLNCIQQIEGGVVQGLSNTLFEEIIRNEQGKVVNPNFHDYKIATAMDVPKVEAILVECADPEGPYGAKGIGEPAITPTGAAISNAIARATGVRFLHMLMKPEQMLQKIKQPGETSG